MNNATENSNAQAPTSARIELPNLADVRALGLEMSLDEARLVHTSLSGMIASGRSKSRDKVTQMIRGIVACCRVEGERDGEHVPAAHPELSEFGWPAGQTALRALGIDSDALTTYWLRARTRATDAALPLEWVLAFVPATLWPAVLTVIEWGPEEAARRLEQAVIELAQTPLASSNRRRPADAAVSAGTIATRVTGVHNLFGVLVALRAAVMTSSNSALPRHLLEPWVSKPERPDIERCGASWARVETRGPTFDAARALLSRVHAEVKSAPRRSRYYRLRRRTVASLLLAHGPRVEALRALNVDDYLPSHNFGDGTVGPAVVYRPGKTRAADEQHILALPAEAAGWLEEWITYTGRSIGQPGSPMWPARKPKAGEAIRRINASAFARSISGHQATDGTGSTPLIPRGDNPYHGYNPHSYRHTAFQFARSAGAKAMRENPESFAQYGVDDFARAVVGHDLIRSVADVYRDLPQQHLARIAIEYAWVDLRTHPTLRGPDIAAIDEATERVELLTSANAAVGAEFNDLRQRQTQLNRHRATLTGDALEAARIDSNTLVFELAKLQTQIATTRSRLELAKKELEHALAEEVEYDPAQADSYLDRLEQVVQCAQAALAADELNPHDELNVSELASVLAVTPKTINGWIRNGFPAKRTPLWAADAWARCQRRIRTIPVRDLDQSVLTPIQRERLLLLRLRRPQMPPRRADAA